MVGEDGNDGIEIGGEYPGAAFRELQRALLDLADRGVLLAIASKNNPADALEVLRDIRACCCGPSTSPRCASTGTTRRRSLREIAAELNIGLDSLAFLDDNPVERAHVRHEVPEVTVIELPEDPMAYAHALRSCPLFERLPLSAEDRERGQYYAAQRQRSDAAGRDGLAGRLSAHARDRGHRRPGG